MTRVRRQPRHVLPGWVVRVMGYCLAALLVVAVTWVTLRVLAAVTLVVFSVVVALLLAAVIAPGVEWARRHRSPRWLAALVGEVAMVAAVAGVLTLVVRRALNQVNDVEQAVTQALQDVQAFLTGPPLSLSEQRVSSIRSRVSDALLDLLPDGTAAAAAALDLLTALVLVLFVLFFLLKDGPRMWAWALRWAPPVRRETVGAVGEIAWGTLTGYVRAMVLIALLDAVLIGAGLFVMGVPLAFSLTLFVFLGAFVPIIGATISGALAVAVTAVTVGTWQAVVVLGIVLLVQQLEGNLIQPLVMERAVSLHPVVVVLAVTVGALVGQVGGAAIAVPLVAVVYQVMDHLVGPSSQRRQAPEEPGRSADPA